MTAIVISGGERGGGLDLVRALERGAGGTAMGDEEILAMAAEGGGGGTLLLSWALFGAHPLADREGMERTHGRARVCQALVRALGNGARIFYGDLGHLLHRFPVAVFRVLVAHGAPGHTGWVRRRRRLFGKSYLDHVYYDMVVSGTAAAAGAEARAILDRSAVAFGDPGRLLPGASLRSASDMIEAEIDLLHRGVNAEFWSTRGALTLWNRSSFDNLGLEERVRQVYALGSVVCRRGASPLLFDERVRYSVNIRVEGQRGLAETASDVALRNGSRPETARHDVVLHSGLGWEGRFVVDVPEALPDPEEVVWRLRALYPDRRLILPAPRYAWLASRMGLEQAGLDMNEGE